jgi:hypothetical protein
MILSEIMNERVEIIIKLETDLSHAPDLLAAFAIMAAEQDAKIDGTIQAVAKNETASYNSQLVSWVTDSATNMDIPVITRSTFATFVVTNKLDTMRNCNFLFNALSVHHIRREDPDKIKFPYIVGKKNAEMIRADRLSELNRRLEDGDMKIKRVGDHMIKLLGIVESSIYDTQPVKSNGLHLVPSIS